MPVALPVQARGNERVASLGIPSTLKEIPVGTDENGQRFPLPKGIDNEVFVFIDTPNINVGKNMRFDVELEGTLDPLGIGPWFPMISATGMPASYVHRDTGELVPNRIAYSSTRITADGLPPPTYIRVIVTPDRGGNFGARIEVL